jgi:kumamolisin
VLTSCGRPRALGALVLVGILLVGSLAMADPHSAGAPADRPTPAATFVASAGRVDVAPAYSPPASVGEVGALAPTTPLEVLVGLSVADPAAFSAYAQAVSVEGGPLYHQFLTPTEFAQRFGPSPASIGAAVRYFQGYGLLASASPDGLLITVSGTASEIGAAFATSFAEYTTAAGRSFFAHSSPAYLPAIAPWSGVLGLGNSTPIVPDLTELPGAPSHPAAGGCSGSPDELVPCQVWGAYDMAGLLANGTDGAGTTIGVVDTYDGAEPQSQLAADLASFDDLNALPAPSVQWVYAVPTSENLNATSNGWGVEEALDLEWAHAAAPGASIDFAFSPDSGPGLYASIDWLVDHEAVNVLSLSWGEPDVGVFNAYSGPCPSACNASTDGSYDLLDPVLELAAAEGISVFAASGDCGAADGTSGVSTNYPASDPYVTAVGGTVLNVSASGTYGSEIGWSGNVSGAASPGCQNQGGSGGGWAPGARPWWQAGAGLPASPDLRGVPDVSLDAGTPVTIVYDGGEGGVLGTSLASPVWAGIAALADQQAGRPLGFLDPQLYRILEGSDYATAFHDIELGYNGYSAGAGWDPVTGIGSPIVGALVGLLAPQSFPESNLATRLTASVGFGAAPLSVTFGVTVSGGSGTYPLEGVAFGDGNASFASGGVASHVYPTPGVYVAAAYSADSTGNTSVSPALGIVVGGGGELAVSIAASDTSPSLGSSVTLTATASGGTAPYSYYFQFGDGSTENWSGAASVAHPYDAVGSFCAQVVVADAGHPVDGGMSQPVAIDVGGAPSISCGISLPPPPLVVEAGPSLERGTAPLTVNFSATAQGGVGGPYAFAWSFGDGNASTARNVSHTYARAGRYDAVLTVTDADGATAVANWTIVVVAPPAAPPSVPGFVLAVVIGGAVGAGALALFVGLRLRRWGTDGPRAAPATGGDRVEPRRSAAAIPSRRPTARGERPGG